MFNTNYALKSYGQCHDEDIRMIGRKNIASEYENDADNEMKRIIISYDDNVNKNKKE